MEVIPVAVSLATFVVASASFVLTYQRGRRDKEQAHQGRRRFHVDALPVGSSAPVDLLYVVETGQNGALVFRSRPVSGAADPDTVILRISNAGARAMTNLDVDVQISSAPSRDWDAYFSVGTVLTTQPVHVAFRNATLFAVTVLGKRTGTVHELPRWETYEPVEAVNTWAFELPAARSSAV